MQVSSEKMTQNGTEVNLHKNLLRHYAQNADFFLEMNMTDAFQVELIF